ncbi:MAG TPA: preprotein translocase subunit SecG [Deltaproteobacteria bacterium]|nr:preprotein translocase subunit SecG [Deltaproteobacteria bacterium]
MYGVLLTVHIVVSVLLIVSVLLQSGKGADIGAVFGGAGSQALFGSAGPADFLNKATRVLVIVFMVTSLTLGYFAFEKPTQSIMDTQKVSDTAIPAAPAQPAQGTQGAAPADVPAAPAPAAEK